MLDNVEGGGEIDACFMLVSVRLQAVKYFLAQWFGNRAPWSRGSHLRISNESTRKFFNVSFKMYEIL